MRYQKTIASCIFIGSTVWHGVLESLFAICVRLLLDLFPLSLFALTRVSVEELTNEVNIGKRIRGDVL
jgi:hypothetical protein